MFSAIDETTSQNLKEIVKRHITIYMLLTLIVRKNERISNFDSKITLNFFAFKTERIYSKRVKMHSTKKISDENNERKRKKERRKDIAKYVSSRKCSDCEQ